MFLRTCSKTRSAISGEASRASGVLLGEEGITGESFAETMTDDDLGREIGEGDRGAVALGERVTGGDDSILDSTGEAADLGHDFGGYLLFVFVHGRRV